MAKTQHSLETLLNSSGMPGLRRTAAAVMTLAFPAIVEQVMLTLVQYIDTAMVGSLGSAATAAVGLTASTTWLIGGFLNAAAVGFSVQVAQHIGAGRAQRAREVTGQALQFIVWFGLLIGALAVGLSWPLPYWLHADPEIIQPASLYFRIVSCAVPFNFCVMMLSSILRCAGDTKTPMLLNLLVNVLNIIFNFFFIYPTRTMTLGSKTFTMVGAGLGVAGAAWGSLLSLLVVSLLFLAVLYGKKSPVRPERGQKYRFQRDCLSTAWRLGVPVALERSLMSMAQIVITGLISGISMVAVAANHLAVTAESLSYMPAYGVAAAATTMVGQALGAGRKDLARRFGTIVTAVGVLIMTVGGVLLFVFARQLIMLFTPDEETIALGMQVLRIVAFAEPFFAMGIVITGVLRGAGDTRAPFLICLITMWGVRITLSFLLAKPLGLVGVWIAMAIELVVRGVLFLVRQLSGRWLEVSLFAKTADMPQSAE